MTAKEPEEPEEQQESKAAAERIESQQYAEARENAQPTIMNANRRSMIAISATTVAATLAALAALWALFGLNVVNEDNYEALQKEVTKLKTELADSTKLIAKSADAFEGAIANAGIYWHVLLNPQIDGNVLDLSLGNDISVGIGAHHGHTTWQLSTAAIRMELLGVEQTQNRNAPYALKVRRSVNYYELGKDLLVETFLVPAVNGHVFELRYANYHLGGTYVVVLPGTAAGRFQAAFVRTRKTVVNGPTPQELLPVDSRRVKNGTAGPIMRARQSPARLPGVEQKASPG